MPLSIFPLKQVCRGTILFVLNYMTHALIKSILKGKEEIPLSIKSNISSYVSCGIYRFRHGTHIRSAKIYRCQTGSLTLGFCLCNRIVNHL